MIWLVPNGFNLAQANDAVAELNRLGLLDARGDVDESLAGRLRILDQASRVLDVVTHAERPTFAVLAATERRAVLIVHDGHEVTVRRADAQSLGAQAVRVLPDTPAGYGRSVSVPTDKLRKAAAEAGDDSRALETALNRRGVSRGDAHMIAVMNQGAVHTAQFGVTIGKQRGDRVIGWWRNESGGYLTEEHAGWTTIVPTDMTRLASQVDRFALP